MASPTELRGRRRRTDRLAADGGLALRLPVTPGYDWAAIRSFLAARAIPGVETVDGEAYRRTITVADAPGLLEVCAGPGDGCLLLRVHLPYWEGLIHVVERVSRVLGTDADHAAGPAIRHADPVLGALAGDLGLAIPGAWNPFEAGVWAILSGGHAGGGQLLAAFVTHLGRPVPGLSGGLTHTFPDPTRVTPENLAPIGLPEADEAAVAALAATLSPGGQAQAEPDRWRPWLALAAAHLVARRAAAHRSTSGVPA